MTLNATKVREAVMAGYSPVCATCKHFWVARDLNEVDCGKKDCGGPIAGKDFPEYDGPITQLDKFCFACTRESEYAVRSAQAKRLVGVCCEHLKLLDRLVPKEVRGQSSHLEVISPRGIVVPLNGRYSPKSLQEVVLETEQAWSEQDKENGHG